MKWGKIKKVVHEFQDVCQGNMNTFEAMYSGLAGQYTKLVKAIDESRKARKELKPRPRE